ncbi:hypothetical protein CC1G_05496 [Coprinopsis cinerea okayama7|uniref:CxC2-like cysteine cluster KDZ transposase-associated domain-containing protein n=1 Tax=Coprinopsis cinerea (strain Okayama-7 / 130 / ATCC MYA-4618 / FGSC 9003) TaxID=240176 RepID=A8P5H2_COPC7|nr:hypothetical protein CC1G_05496 [Coprinopsis cinerea okayama7\|eukprot:XP_001838943.2 hypothetical protein CC1G_05496 [Coprinopsis cinerea okayama7\
MPKRSAKSVIVDRPTKGVLVEIHTKKRTTHRIQPIPDQVQSTPTPIGKRRRFDTTPENDWNGESNYRVSPPPDNQGQSIEPEEAVVENSNYDYMLQWNDRINIYLNHLYNNEIRGGAPCQGCGSGDPLWRCNSCFDKPKLCSQCCRSRHLNQPLHRVEIWTGEFYESSWLWKLGISIHLGHGGEPCPCVYQPPFSFPSNDDYISLSQSTWENHHDFTFGASPQMGRDGHGQEMVLVHTNGIHQLAVYQCLCPGAPSIDEQCVLGGLYPSTFKSVATVFTLELLQDFTLASLECQTSASDYFSKLRRLTNPEFPDSVPDRYRELLRASRQFGYLQELMRFGCPAKESAVAPGSLAFFCAACPQPDVNLEPGWERDSESWKYTMSFIADGNFVCVRQTRKGSGQDLFLKQGQGYFVGARAYKSYLNGAREDIEPSTCNQHRAVADKNKAHKGYEATGIAEFLLKLFKTSVENLQEVSEALEMLKASASEETRSRWDAELEAAQRLREGKKPESMDILLSKLEKAPSRKSIETKLIGAEAAANKHVGVSIWVSEGIAIQEDQMEVLGLLADQKVATTESRTLEVERKRAQLLKRSNDHHQEALKFFPKLTPPGGSEIDIAVVTAPIREPCDCEDNCGHMGMNIDPFSDVAAGPIEKMTVLLPSSVSARVELFSKHAIEAELKLRQAQADEALENVRTQVGYKSFLFKANIQLAENKAQKTRGYAAVATADKAIRRWTRVYNQARWAITALTKDAAVLGKYPPLLKADLTPLQSIYQPNAPGMSRQNVSWIWGRRSGSIMNDPEFLQESPMDSSKDGKKGEVEFTYSPPGTSPEMVGTMFADLDTLDFASLQQFLYYLSSRKRSAGLAYGSHFAQLSIDQRAEFLKILFDDITWHTMIFGFASLRYPEVKPGEAHRNLGRLFMHIRYGDPTLIVAACSPSYQNVPDRLLAHYEANWWNPFDPAKNWDNSNISFVIKTFRHQRQFMMALPRAPLPSNRLSDLSLLQLRKCADSIDECIAMIGRDINLSAREIAKAVALYCRWKVLLLQARVAQKKRAEAAQVDGLVARGINPAYVADLLNLRLQLAFTAFAQDDTGSLWKARHNCFADEVTQAIFFVGLSKFYETGNYVGAFTSKVVEDWDDIFDGVEQGRLPLYLEAEAWILDPNPVHELMPAAWWKPNAASIALIGISQMVEAWAAYMRRGRPSNAPNAVDESYREVLEQCVGLYAGCRDGVADQLDLTAQQLLPAFEATVNRLSDISLYPLYGHWYKICSKSDKLALIEEWKESKGGDRAETSARGSRSGSALG